MATTENDPNSFVEGVNVITGDYLSIQEDVLVQGAEPIALRRCYVSQKGEGTWGFHNYHKAVVHLKHQWVQLTEPNGTTLYYRYKDRMSGYTFSLWDPASDAEGFSNTARGSLSARNNLKNQYLSMPEGQKTFTVHCPDGTERVYHRDSKDKPKSTVKKLVKYFKRHMLGREGPDIVDYLLIEERLPNGHKILYEWPEGEKDVWQIQSCDQTGKIIYAWVRFYPKKEGKNVSDGDYGVETSDGRHFEYKYFDYKDSYQLREIESDEKPKKTTLHYVDYRDKKLLNAITWEKDRYFNLKYYGPKDGDAISFRVKELIAPVGTNKDNVITHRFNYDMEAKKTTVLDAYLTPTDYYWDDSLRLIRVDRFIDKNRLYNRTQFVWGKNESRDVGCLLCKVLFDEEERPLSAIRYFYDKRGNVKEERFYGNLSGAGPSLTIDEEGFPIEDGVEYYRKQYKHSKDRSLLLEQKEDNGLFVEYAYLDDAPLVKEERVYDKGVLKTRKTYGYNQEKILIREVTDDVIANIRRIQETALKKSGPYVGMPEVIKEKVEDATGLHTMKTVILHYTAGGKVERKEVYDSLGAFRYEETYRYEEGCLVEEKDAMGYITKNHFDEFGNKTKHISANKKSELLVNYDFSNRPIRFSENGAGIYRTYYQEYNFLHQKVGSTDEYGHKTTYVYDPFGHLLETHFPLEDGKKGVTSSVYNAAGQEICHVDARGYKIKRSYNAYGHPVAISYPDGTEESFSYYLDGKLKAHEDQNRLRTFYSYDSLGQILSKESICGKESFTYSGCYPVSHTDAEGRVTTYSYDSAGRKIKENQGKESTLYAYDTLGRLDRVTTEDLVHRKKYDLLGRVTDEQKESVDKEIFEVVSYGYDAVGNKISKTQSIAGKPSCELFTYDAFDRLIQYTDPLGHITKTSYVSEIKSKTPPVRMNKKIVVDPLGLQTISEFNAQGLLLSLEKKNSKDKRLLQELYEYDLNNNPAKKTTLLPEREVSICREYDSMNRIERLIEGALTPEEKVTCYTYTPKGLLERTIKPSGIILTHTYNKLNQLIEQTSSDGTIAYRYEYDKTGLLLNSKDVKTQETLIRKYDFKGRVIEETLPNGLTVENRYDLLGRRTRLTLPDSSYIGYDYGSLYLERVARFDQNFKCLYTHIYLQRDLSGHILIERLPHNLGQVKHDYDLFGSHVEVSSRRYCHQALLFDPVHNLLEDRRQGELSTYSYDDLYQLCSEKTHTYSYDALYNRIKKDDTDISINSLNQIEELSYDKDGNPTFLKGKTLSYDAFDRLIAVEDLNTRITYAYDTFHRRISKKTYVMERFSLVSEIRYLYDGQNEIGSFDSTGLCLELRILGETPYAELGSAIALELSGKVYVPLHDLQGNVAALCSLYDQSFEEYRYSSFGEELFFSPPSQNPWRFASKRIDPETGLIFYGRRYYLPEQGRFLTSDPLGFQAGPNLYAFVFNCPLTHMDLYGLSALIAGPCSNGLLLEEAKNAVYMPLPEKSVGIEHPSLHFLFLNGINTSEREGLSYIEKISECAGGIKTTRIHNPSTSFAMDVGRCVIGLSGLGIDATEEIRQYFIEFDRIHTGTNRKLFVTAHSRGGIPLYNALNRVSRDVQQRVIVLAIAPAKVIPRRLCFDSFNYASKRDFVPQVGLCARIAFSEREGPCLEKLGLKVDAVQEMQDYRELIWLDPHPDAPLFDHSFVSKTFSEVIQRNIINYINSYGKQ
ncbi:MAG: RHS repeat-associated core domain-containing protein [Chlamydiota bacterium]